MNFKFISFKNARSIGGVTTGILDGTRGFTDMKRDGDHVVARLNGRLFWIPNADIACAEVDESAANPPKLRTA